MAEPLEISAQGTPNPNAAKFTLNRVVTAEGKTYRDAASAETGWARQLLSIADGVIVASSLKRQGLLENPVDVERVRSFVHAAKQTGIVA